MLDESRRYFSIEGLRVKVALLILTKGPDEEYMTSLSILYVSPKEAEQVRI